MLTIEQLQVLSMPFEADLIEWRAGAVTKDRSKCLALAYVDSRHYMQRLDQVDPDWGDQYEIYPDATVLCRLTVAGVTRCDLGSKDEADENSLTAAAAQAFKRACVKFGLGRHLYFTPSTWVEYDAGRKRISDHGKYLLRQMNAQVSQQQPPAATPEDDEIVIMPEPQSARSGRKTWATINNQVAVRFWATLRQRLATEGLKNYNPYKPLPALETLALSSASWKAVLEAIQTKDLQRGLALLEEEEVGSKEEEVGSKE